MHGHWAGLSRPARPPKCLTLSTAFFAAAGTLFTRRYFRAASSRFREADRDGLFATLDLFAGTAGAQLAFLHFVHRLMHFFLRFRTVFPSGSLLRPVLFLRPAVADDFLRPVVLLFLRAVVVFLRPPEPEDFFRPVVLFFRALELDVFFRVPEPDFFRALVLRPVALFLRATVSRPPVVRDAALAGPFARAWTNFTMWPSGSYRKARLFASKISKNRSQSIGSNCASSSPKSIRRRPSVPSTIAGCPSCCSTHRRISSRSVVCCALAKAYLPSDHFEPR